MLIIIIIHALLQTAFSCLLQLMACDLCIADVSRVTDVMLKALEKAKEAGRLEKNLRQSRERGVTGSPGSPADQPNFDLTYSVSLPTLLTSHHYILFT